MIWPEGNPCVEELTGDVDLSEIRLGKHGGDRRSDGFQVGITKLISAKGMTAEYTIARLERDGHTELADRVRRSALVSVLDIKSSRVLRARWRAPYLPSRAENAGS
jgi:hypothetical protein